MKFRLNNKSEPAVLACIKKESFLTASQIAAATGLRLRTVEQALVRLMKRKLIHIGEYDVRTAGPGRVARRFADGSGRNANKPTAPTDSERKAKRNIWQRNRRAQLAVQRRLQTNPGVFGVLIAQVSE